MNVGQLRQLIQDLPDDAEVLASYIPEEYADQHLQYTVMSAVYKENKLLLDWEE